MFRSAFNPIIAEAHDASHGLYNSETGETLIQGKSGLPVFVGAMSFAVKAVIDKVKTEKIDLEFTDDGIETLAKLATEVNSSVENIGARRLHTIIEKVLDEISFTATDRSGEKIIIDKKYVKKNLGELVKDTDLSKFIL